MARISVEPGAVAATSKLLHQLADANRIQFFPHEPDGALFVVDDDVAESFVLAVEAQNEEPKPAKKKTKG